MSSNIMKNSGDYELISASIITKSSNPVEIDVSRIFLGFVVYESIFDNTISGNITISDSNNLWDDYSFGSGETIILEWRTSGVDSSIKVIGEVYDIMGPDKVNDHTSAYTLHFASFQMLDGSRKKTFRGFKETVSNIVNLIKPKIDKNIDIENTIGIEHIVFTGQTLWQAISLCCSKAVSVNQNLGYLFYEDNQKFNFKSIESLYSQNPVVEYNYKDSPIYDDVKNSYEEMFSVIQDYEFIDSNKYIDDILDGQYGTSAGYLSLNNKQFNIYNSYTKKEQQNKINEDKLTISYSINPSINDSHISGNNLEILKSSSFGISIGVFGNSTLYVGQTALITVPKFSILAGSNEKDSFSGKALITSIKHSVDLSGYTQRILLTRRDLEND